MENKMYNVKNRSASRVFYRIPEERIRREFSPGEVKRISGAELEQLSYQPGGREIMEFFLQIQDVEKVTDLGLVVEPEYNMNEAAVIDLIKTGSLDAFLDCLDFAPIGVIDLLKTYAVSIPLSDFEKRKAMREKLGFDVDAAIKNNETDPEEAKGAVLTPAGSTTPGRRTSGAGYIKKAVTAEE
jgi:hypothetical protein